MIVFGPIDKSQRCCCLPVILKPVKSDSRLFSLTGDSERDGMALGGVLCGGTDLGDIQSRNVAQLVVSGSRMGRWNRDGHSSSP